MSAPVTVSDIAAPSRIRLNSESDVTIFPKSVHNGRGSYSESALDFADELNQTGAVARPWHDPAECEISTERGPVTETVVAIVLGIASSAGWDALKWALSRKPRTEQVSLTVGWRDGSAEKWVRVEGPADAVAETIVRLRD